MRCLSVTRWEISRILGKSPTHSLLLAVSDFRLDVCVLFYRFSIAEDDRIGQGGEIHCDLAGEYKMGRFVLGVHTKASHDTPQFWIS